MMDICTDFKLIYALADVAVTRNDNTLSIVTNKACLHETNLHFATFWFFRKKKKRKEESKVRGGIVKRQVDLAESSLGRDLATL